MIDGFAIWVYAAGAAQALFLTLALVTLKTRNRAATLYLALAIAILGALLAEVFWDFSGGDGEIALGLAIEFGLAPALYLFVAAIADPGRRARLRDGAHFGPLAAALVVLAVLHAVNQGGPNIGVRHPVLGPAVITLAFIKLFYFAAYAVFTERNLRAGLAAAPPHHAPALRWIHRWFLVVIATFAASYLIFILFLLEVPLWRDSDAFAGLATVIGIFSIAYLLLANKQVLERAPPRLAEPSPADHRNAERIAAHMRQSRPYLDADLDLEALAAGAGLSAEAARGALAALGEESLSAYLNRLRLDAFEALVHAPENRAKTTLELAYAAGFNSKATFYRAFRARRGVTPRDYRSAVFDPQKASHAPV